MENFLVRKAIENKNLLEFYYEGGLRVVEPHCHGLTTKGNPAVRAYQVDGYSSSGRFDFKMFDLSKASSLRVLEETFDGPRDRYNKGDKGMSVIFCEL